MEVYDFSLNKINIHLLGSISVTVSFILYLFWNNLTRFRTSPGRLLKTFLLSRFLINDLSASTYFCESVSLTELKGVKPGKRNEGFSANFTKIHLFL